MNLIPPSILLMGDSGAGKTSALTTFIPAGVETFVLCTEPGGPESLMDWAQKQRYDISKLHWATVLPATQGWSGLVDMATRISTTNFEDLAKLKNGIGKEFTRPAAMKLLSTLSNFTCERDGKSYGDVTAWGPDRCFSLDSLSGLSVLAWALTVGHKPTAHMGEWSIAMNFISDLVMKLTSDRGSYFVLTAHVEKEMNEITGVNQIMTSTLGKKLAPKLPRFFSEVIYAKKPGKMGDPFTWATIDPSASLKNRGLPMSDKLAPDFAQVVNSYTARVKNAGAPAATPATKSAA
jgi:hypothetical protein